MNPRTRRRQRAMLIGVFALFFIPVLSAYVLRLFPGLIGEYSTSNRGEFIKPPVSVEPGMFTVVGQDRDGNPLDFDEHWTILSFNDGTCDDTCATRLDALANVQVAMHKDKDRVRRVVVLPPSAPVPQAVAADTNVTVVRADPDVLAELTGTSRPHGEAGIHLVDPRGFLFMRYARDQSASDLLKDLKRLLRISKVG